MPCFSTCFRPEGKIAPLSCHSFIRYWMSNMASDAKVSFSSKIEYRAVILCGTCIWKGKQVRKYIASWSMFMGLLHHRMHKLNSGLGNLKHSRMSLEDETRSGRPSEATHEEICNKLRDLVYSDELRWKKYRMHYTFHMVAFQQLYMIAWVCTS